MLAEKLKINNLIRHDGKVMNVFHLDKGGLGYSKVNYISIVEETGLERFTNALVIERIRLSRDWLIKLGFEQSSKYKDLYMKGAFGVWWYDEYNACMAHQCVPSNIKYEYVDELQNFYEGLHKEKLSVI